MFRRLGSASLLLLATAVLVLLTALAPVDPVRDAATGSQVTEVSLQKSAAYVALSPVSEILDTFTLYSVRQHIAFAVTIIFLAALWWMIGGRRTHGVTPPRAIATATRAVSVLMCLLILYACVAVLPRPMAMLVPDTDLLAVDFHSHTKYSHDGRPGWGAEELRAWHRDAGFSVAYVTDHRTFDGAREAWANNPVHAGDGVVLIPGIETGWRGEHVNVLDADRMYTGILSPTLRDIDEAALGLASMLANNEPVVIETFPGDVSKVPVAAGRGTMGIRALELVDGSPRGLGQTRQQRAQLVQFSDSNHIAFVTGSDNHGWGRTASAWTLMYVPQWRGMTPRDLSIQISNVLRISRSRASRIVERYLVNTDAAFLVPFTVPLTAVGMLRSLSGEERAAWIAWLVVALALVQARRSRKSESAAQD